MNLKSVLPFLERLQGVYMNKKDIVFLIIIILIAIILGAFFGKVLLDNII